MPSLAESLFEIANDFFERNHLLSTASHVAQNNRSVKDFFLADDNGKGLMPS